MKVDNLKDLKQLIQLCQKQGVSTIKVDGIELTLIAPVAKRATSVPDYSSDFPEASIQVPKFNGEISPVEAIKTEELTPEQLLMWSAKSDEQMDQQ